MRTYSSTARFDLGNLCNGILVGCVAVTGAADRIENWAAIIIGIASSFCYIAGCAFIKLLKIDDPVEATCVHGFGGLCGIISVGLFDN
jgi:Amt family ammonium transporter